MGVHNACPHICVRIHIRAHVHIVCTCMGVHVHDIRNHIAQCGCPLAIRGCPVKRMRLQIFPGCPCATIIVHPQTVVGVQAVL
nr:MAG TPA: hypothetical protein [Caudoviricetes sp.]